MLKEYAQLFRKLMVFFDFCILTTAFFLGYFLRVSISPLYPLNTYLKLLPVFLLIWILILNLLGMYTSFRTKKIMDILFIIFKTALYGFIFFSSFIYVLRIVNISRIMIVIMFIFATLFLSFEKVLLILLFYHARKKGLNYRNILIIGTGKRAQRFIDTINHHAEWGFNIVGLIDEDEVKKGEIVKGYRVIGSFKDIPQIINHNVIDEVVFVIPRSWIEKIEWIMHLCEDHGLRIHMAVDYFELKFSKARQTNLMGFPLLTFESTPDKLWHLLIKRIFDVFFSTIALLGLLPIFAAIAIIIKLTSKGPVLFRQKRCTVNGRIFTLLKFRTMIYNAEDMLDNICKDNEMQGPVFKIKNDPRLTTPGKFLRKYSIDELPQLWNILNGDMSLVGPRPPIPVEVTKYDAWQYRRLSMRPGLTCLWQVNGRNTIADFTAWAKLDLEYIDNWSLWLDCRIFLKTIPTVLSVTGAY